MNIILCADNFKTLLVSLILCSGVPKNDLRKLKDPRLKNIVQTKQKQIFVNPLEKLFNFYKYLNICSHGIYFFSL